MCPQKVHKHLTVCSIFIYLIISFYRSIKRIFRYVEFETWMFNNNLVIIQTKILHYILFLFACKTNKFVGTPKMHSIAFRKTQSISLHLQNNAEEHLTLGHEQGDEHCFSVTNLQQTDSLCKYRQTSLDRKSHNIRNKLHILVHILFPSCYFCWD